MKRFIQSYSCFQFVSNKFLWILYELFCFLAPWLLAYGFKKADVFNAVSVIGMLVGYVYYEMMMDAVNFGGILSKDNKIITYVKTSPHAKQVFQKAFFVDTARKLFFAIYMSIVSNVLFTGQKESLSVLIIISLFLGGYIVILITEIIIRYLPTGMLQMIAAYVVGSILFLIFVFLGMSVLWIQFINYIIVIYIIVAAGLSFGLNIWMLSRINSIPRHILLLC